MTKRLNPYVAAPDTMKPLIALEATLDAALGVQAGHVSFGFSGGTAMRYRYYHPLH